ncbi:MAG: hypothetical protein WCV85_04535 [Patescibacteria group bacterium]|jgi:hypothetical protein
MTDVAVQTQATAAMTTLSRVSLAFRIATLTFTGSVLLGFGLTYLVWKIRI